MIINYYYVCICRVFAFHESHQETKLKYLCLLVMFAIKVFFLNKHFMNKCK